MVHNKKNRFLAVAFLVCVVAAFAIISLERSSGRISVLFARIIPGSSTRISNPFQPIIDALFYARMLKQQNQELAEQNRTLAERVAQFEERSAQSDFHTQTQALLVNNYVHDARVIGAVLGSGNKRMVINAGSKQGVIIHDWIVIPERTLIGFVQMVNSDTSVIQTILDPELKITASVNRSALSGLFSFANGLGTLDYIAANQTIPQNELVMTSGQDGLFPKGLLLGITKTTFPSSHAPLQAVYVQLAASFANLDYVMVIRNTLELNANQ